MYLYFFYYANALSKCAAGKSSKISRLHRNQAYHATLNTDSNTLTQINSSVAKRKHRIGDLDEAGDISPREVVDMASAFAEFNTTFVDVAHRVFE